MENCQPATSCMSYNCQAIRHNKFTTQMLNEVATKPNNFTDILRKIPFCQIEKQFKCFCDIYCILVSAAVLKLSSPDGEDHKLSKIDKTLIG